MDNLVVLNYKQIDILVEYSIYLYFFYCIDWLKFNIDFMLMDKNMK